MFIFQDKKHLSENYDPYFISIKKIKLRCIFYVLISLFMLTGTIIVYLYSGSYSIPITSFIIVLSFITLILVYDSVYEYVFFKRLDLAEAAEQDQFEKELHKNRSFDPDAPLIGSPLAHNSNHELYDKQDLTDAFESMESKQE